MRWTFDEPCAMMERNSTPCHTTSVVVSDLNLVLVASDYSRDSSLAMFSKDVQNELEDMMSEHQDSFQDGSVVGARTPVLRTPGGKRFALVGLGPLGDYDPIKEHIGLKVGVTIANICIEEKGITSCLVSLPCHGYVVHRVFIEDMTCSFHTQLYSDNRYRSGDNRKIPAEKLKNLYVYTTNWDDSWFLESMHRGKILSDGIMLAKDIVNAPHNILNSESLANLARKLAEESTSGRLTCSILDKEECERLGMGAFLAVARGSETEPQFIHMTYKSDGAIK